MRADASFRRKSRQLPARPRILIVCEGGKTEPLYFSALCRDKDIAGKVVICGEECGTHPRSVVEYAVRERDEEDREGDGYDEVWCVFDRDEHEKIHEALSWARDQKIRVAYSNPCFELWYLIHFRYSTAHIERDEAASELRREHIAGYHKSLDVYDALLVHRSRAVRHAAGLRKHHKTANDGRPENPSTSVDRLVVALNELSKPRPYEVT